MIKHNIRIAQNLYRDNAGEIHNEYHLWSENGIYLGYLRFPSNCQYLYDDRTLDFMLKYYATRLGFIGSKKSSR